MEEQEEEGCIWSSSGDRGREEKQFGEKVTKEEGKEEDGDSSYTKVCGQRSDAARRTEEGCR